MAAAINPRSRLDQRRQIPPPNTLSMFAVSPVIFTGGLSAKHTHVCAPDRQPAMEAYSAPQMQSAALSERNDLHRQQRSVG